MDGLYSSFVLLTVPLFIVTANIMNTATISDQLLQIYVALVGRFRGGLAGYAADRGKQVGTVVFQRIDGHLQQTRRLSVSNQFLARKQNHHKVESAGLGVVTVAVLRYQFQPRRSKLIKYHARSG
ncbi:hypothetical protein IWQ54_006246 [Labrenzia sp. EL_195]|nr:hypothetical protein [Labrenzia sp. EL_195]